MIAPAELAAGFESCGVSLYAGVPDSVLKEFCAYVAYHGGRAGHPRHVITANEGAAVALAAGHYLATGDLAVVYMQNSGLGNAVNPLTSLVDPAVFGIPLLLLVGWRGAPGTRDEPQHLSQGQKTIGLLETLAIPYAIIDATTETHEVLRAASQAARDKPGPYALLVRGGTFGPCRLRAEHEMTYPLSRELALEAVLRSIGPAAIVVIGVGMMSREVFEYREAAGQGDAADLLVVGSMGHASQIALGIAVNKPGMEVYCLDGDGAVIMHMGAMACIGSVSPPNFRHVIINNGAHDSVGGLPTAGFLIDFCAVGLACGYAHCVSTRTVSEIADGVRSLHAGRGPVLMEVRVRKGARESLGRPRTSPVENKRRFMELLRKV